MIGLFSNCFCYSPPKSGFHFQKKTKKTRKEFKKKTFKEVSLKLGEVLFFYKQGLTYLIVAQVC